MQLADLPRVKLERVQEKGIGCRYDSSPLIGEGWIGCLFVGDGRFIWGRFQQVDTATGVCVFVPDEIEELRELRAGQSYPYLDGYWGRQAQLVLDESRAWEKR